MNANELADKAESVQTWEYGTTDDWIEQAATMLRQQQAEIEALKKEAALQRLSDFTQEAEKTLTDFEIKGVLALDECWIGEDCSIPDMIAFARAILKKANEK